MAALTIPPSLPILSFSPSSPIAASHPALSPSPTSPRAIPSSPPYALLSRDPSPPIFTPSILPSLYPSPVPLTSKRRRPSPAPLSTSPTRVIPSFNYITMCRPSSPIDRFYSPKKYSSDPMGLPEGIETLKDITKDNHYHRRRYVFFLDYDGTLTPIVDDPDRAIIAEETREVIRDLAGRFDTAIVTGRSLNKVRNLMKLDECYYAGSHGWDIDGPEGSEVRKRVGDKFLVKFRKALDMLDEALDDDRFPGATVENNVFSVSVHYRNCSPAIVGELEEEVDRIVYELGMVKRHGKKVFEIRPAFNWHKGKAVDYLIERLQRTDSDLIPIYIGDDVTDEDAFKALNGRGISVIVADSSTKRDTYADLRLRDPSEVRTFLSYFVDNA